MTEIVPVESITSKIHVLRDVKVIMDRDLAQMYGVEKKALKQAVRRNSKRFPADFLFELTDEEFSTWKSQPEITRDDRKGMRCKPMAFTEQGVAMLSSVLRSERAIEVNIAIMRAFVVLRDTMAANKELARKLIDVEKRLKEHDDQLRSIAEAYKKLTKPADSARNKIGFGVIESRAAYTNAASDNPT